MALWGVFFSQPVSFGLFDNLGVEAGMLDVLSAFERDAVEPRPPAEVGTKKVCTLKLCPPV